MTFYFILFYTVIILICINLIPGYTIIDIVLVS